MNAVLVGFTLVFVACSSNGGSNADPGPNQRSSTSRGSGTTLDSGGQPPKTATQVSPSTLADDFVDDPDVTTTTLVGAEPQPVDDDTYSDLVDEVVSMMADTRDNPCAVRAAYDEYLKLPKPDSEVQVERVIEGLFLVFLAMADTFPIEHEDAAQAVREFIEEFESETALDQYSVEAFLDFVPSEAAESAFQLFERTTDLC